MSNGRPPLPSASSRSRSNCSSPGGSSANSSRRSSNSPSNSSNNEHGQEELDARLRSVLHHPFGLSLLFAMYEKETPVELKHLPQLQCVGERELWKGVFNGCVEAWIEERRTAAENGTKKPDEPNLTRRIVDAINSIAQTGPQPFSAKREMKLQENSKVHGKVDIVLSPEDMETSEGEGSTPLMVVEVGLHSGEWFRKLDQAAKYLKKMCKGQANELARFEKPLLFAVITIDDNQGHHVEEVVFQMGIFLCTRKDSSKPGEANGNFRMALLRQFKTNDQKEASVFFGRMLWLTEEIYQMRKDTNNNAGQNVDVYQYFSSNCCKIGNRVVRIYDNRFRKTQRTPDVYLNCSKIVGNSSEILSLKRGDEDFIDGFNMAGIEKGKPILTIICTPYYQGQHIASKPSDFVPIIQQLQKLHEEGYVHGDIRAFNTIIGGGRKSWLIDFDFGGKLADEVTYPTGYRSVLPDGRRHGEGGDRILPWHDWYALGVLIFSCYKFLVPNDIENAGVTIELRRLKLMDKWTDIELELMTDNDVEELTKFLNDADNAGYKVKQKFLTKSMQQDATAGTFQGATGSPPKKNA